jgi:1-acyl-sn-glycerol-3-phosphate acyltransferase
MSLRRDLEALARGWRWGRPRLVPASVEQDARPAGEFPTDWARSPLARAARAAILEFGFSPLLRKELTTEVHGSEVFDDLEMPVLFAANHSSHLDAPLVLTSLPQEWRDRTAVGAAADYFFDVWWRAIGTALAFNTFPVERSGSRRSAGAAHDLLDDGWNILVFPEGTRSRDGWMGEFRHGTARLAIEHGVPVVPIAVRGSYQAMPRGRGWPVPGRPPVRVRIGRPLHPKDAQDVSDFSDRIRDALALGLQEDRTDWWDALQRRARGEVTPVTGPEGADWRRRWESSRPIDPHRSRAWPKRG